MPIEALYVHVPFCAHICAYCDFMRVGYHPTLVAQYLQVLKADVAQYDLSHIDTVYFGGGTPSVLGLDELKQLFEIFKPMLKQSRETTFEVNPETLTLEKAKLLAQVGVNRISLGVQSFNATEIQDMDRQHSVSMIESSLELLRSVGLTNISIDLMYGLPFQTLKSLNHSLDEAFRLKLPHLSIYALTIEEHSKWGRQKRPSMDPQLEEAMYDLICARCVAEGYQHYEISNFTQGAPSLHNQHYWHYDDYVGVGPKAASKIGLERFENTSNLLDYSQGKFLGERIQLDATESAFERLMMGLRLEEGIDLERFRQATGFDFLTRYETAIATNLKQGWMEVSATRARCTELGRALLHEVLLPFMSD